MLADVQEPTDTAMSLSNKKLVIEKKNIKLMGDNQSKFMNVTLKPSQIVGFKSMQMKVINKNWI